MQAITPYLNFPGTAAQALELYSRALKGTIEVLQHYGDMLSDPKGLQLPPDAVLHATFRAGDLVLMASDVSDSAEAMPGTNISLSLNFDDVAEMEQVFYTLASGGNVTMPLQDTFWGARFGILTDRYGINWMFNYDYPA